jgi:non-canonical poly(A) RNA polymerase PAPD5/7
MTRLHQEILDFYEWVRPQDFEQDIRRELVSRLQKTFARLEPGCRLEAFGSFAAELYLPIGDMDLVLMTRGYPGSRFSTNPRNLLWFIKSVIDREGIAVPGSLQPIAKAKVPIIKFVDAITGLKVDLSFNNDNGTLATKTFQAWKHQYPALPILVSVVKQFLMIRGLNDVACGGLGGFSSICLVTSLIQHHVPIGQVPNLGILLLQFLHFYGHVFNKREIAIRLEPPGFVRKVGCLTSNCFVLATDPHVGSVQSLCPQS